MTLLRLGRLGLLILLGSGWGLLPQKTSPPTDRAGLLCLTEAWQ